MRRSCRNLAASWGEKPSSSSGGGPSAKSWRVWECERHGLEALPTFRFLNAEAFGFGCLLFAHLLSHLRDAYKIAKTPRRRCRRRGQQEDISRADRNELWRYVGRNIETGAAGCGRRDAKRCGGGAAIDGTPNRQLTRDADLKGSRSKGGSGQRSAPEPGLVLVSEKAA